ncbi:MAG TPA: hypothetical protein VIK02_09545 [Candidatus Anoxymicrobiaceae bacterium]
MKVLSIAAGFASKMLLPLVLDSLGIATKADIHALESRIEELERILRPAPAQKRRGRPPGKKSAKKSSARG